MRKTLKRSLSLLLAITIIFSSAYVGLSEVDFGRGFGVKAKAASPIVTKSQAVAWLNKQQDKVYDFNNANGTQCTEFVRAYVNYVMTGDPWKYCGYTNDMDGWVVWKSPYWSNNKDGWTIYKNTPDFMPQPGDIFCAGSLNHTGVVISSTLNSADIADGNGRDMEWSNGDPVSIRNITWSRYEPTYFIRPHFSDTPVAALTPPTITFNKSSYTEGDTITVSWSASPSNSNLSHYWVRVTDSSGNVYVNNSVDKSKTSYSFITPGVGTYSVTVFATPYGSASGEGSLTDTKTITINPKSYVVSYNANGGSGAPGSQIKYNGVALALSTTKPTRTGYTFLGWSTSATATSPSYYAGDRYTSDSSVTLYAVWRQTLPGNVVITNGSSFQAGDVKFTWNSASNATSYNIKIWEVASDYTETLVYENIGVKSGCIYNLEKGNYKYVIQAVNSYGSTETISNLYVGQQFVPSKYFYYGNNLYEIYEQTKTWEEAKVFCEQIGGHLVTITSQEEQIAIEEHIEASQNIYFWIGATDKDNEGTFKWVTDELFEYTNWDTLGDKEPNDANGGEDYASIKTVDSSTNLMGSWNDSGSASEFGIICEYENIDDMEPIATTTYNGHIYDLYDHKIPCIQAELFAQRKGGHLVSINSSEEEKIVEALIDQGSKMFYWLGGMRFDVDKFEYRDELVWSTGERITYTNYGEGEPNNYSGEEWFLEYKIETGAWNDSTNRGHADNNSGFIVERPVEYDVTYDFKGGVGGPGKEIKRHGEKLYLSVVIPEKEAYTFLGWATDPNATTVEYAPGDEYTLNQGITLYALWEPNHVHDYKYSITKAATCTDDGLGTYVCECEDMYTVEILATGHLNTMWVTEQEATCTEDGYKDEWCLDCGGIVNTEIIPANGHSEGEWTVDVEPTCTDEGSKHKLCSVCNEVVTEVIPAKGHSHSTEWTVDVKPTCTGEGSKSHHCTVCGDKADITVIEPLGHIYSTEWTIDVAPTCTKEGSKSHHCTGCDEMVEDVAVIEALGHNYKLVSVAEEHPHTNTFKCSRCTDTKTEESYLDKCGVCNFSYTDVDSATCRITGYIGGKNTFVIPAAINGKTVSTTTTGAFKNNTTLTSVKIEDGVQGLGSLAFLGCKALSKVVIPESVTSIGANAFYNCASDFTIYCFRDSYAMQYAIDNSLNYVVMDIGETDNCTIDYDNELIFVSIDGLTSIEDILYIPTNSMAFAEASLISGANEFLGTGSTVTVFDGNDISSEYTLIVEGDTNGDSVCDALDAAQVALVSNGHKTIDGAYKMAADNNQDNEISIEDYQAIVNQVVA